MARITVVLATFNRPQALRHAIGGMLGQTVPDWHALVIGDGCGAATGEVVARFADPRIRYINLRDRFGEQSGPNSVGLALAKTPWVAFLNHDDLWLPDFLERGLGMLERQEADLYTGSAVFATSRGLRLRRYALSGISPAGRRIETAFGLPVNDYFEPISGWIVGRAAAERVGRFRPARDLYRAPIEDWILRAARAGLRHVNDDAVVVLKDNSRPRFHRRQTYLEPRVAMGPEARKMQRLGPERYRASIAARVPRLPAPVSAVQSAADDYTHFLQTGEDRIAEAWARAGAAPGAALDRLVRKRTGQGLAEPPDLDAAIAFSRTLLETRDA